MRHLIKLISSNYRATVANGEKFGINSFPIWGDQYRYDLARWYIWEVFGVDIAQ